MCTTRRPAASSACARASTSITSKGSISAARRAVSLSMTVRDYNFLVDEQLKKNALEYHRRKPAGKISVLPTKQLTNQRDQIGRASCRDRVESSVIAGEWRSI